MLAIYIPGIVAISSLADHGFADLRAQ